MPLDSTGWSESEDPHVFVPGLAGLAKLARVLRNREMWPKGHQWSYTCHGQCAIGIAHQLWNTGMNTARIAEAFGIYYQDAYNIFVFGLKRLQPDAKMSDVTPEHVANAIDELLRSKLA
jgi:hypothetical protein